MVARTQQASSYIDAITNVQGVVTYAHAEIIQTFQHFYTDLYSSKFVSSQAEILQFLDRCLLPTVNEADLAILNGPITLEEITEALVGFSNDTSPGADGLLLEVNKKYTETLLPALHKTYNAAADLGYLPSTNEAIIIVLPKLSKDKLLPESYRPISLVNTYVCCSSCGACTNLYTFVR